MIPTNKKRLLPINIIKIVPVNRWWSALMNNDGIVIKNSIWILILIYIRIVDNIINNLKRFCCLNYFGSDHMLNFFFLGYVFKMLASIILSKTFKLLNIWPNIWQILFKWNKNSKFNNSIYDENFEENSMTNVIHQDLKVLNWGRWDVE